MGCPHCHSAKIKKNGHTHYGKQNYQCNDCNRQFVESGQDWFVSSADKEIIDKLLLERISLAGICRVCDVGTTWLQKYIKNLCMLFVPSKYTHTLIIQTSVCFIPRRDKEFCGFNYRVIFLHLSFILSH